MKKTPLLGVAFALLLGLLGLSAGAQAACSGNGCSTVMPESGPHSMADFTQNYLNPALQSLLGSNSGASAPTNGPSAAPVPFETWVNTSASPATLEMFDGAQWVTIGTINASSHAFQVPLASLPTLPPSQISGLAPSATIDTTNAGNISSGTLNVARLPTGIPAANISGLGPFATSSTVPAASVTGLGPFATATTVPSTSVTGLGTAATQNIGTSGAAIPLLNGANTWSGTQTFAAINASAIEANTSTYPILEWYASGNGTDIKGSKEFIDPSGNLDFTFINDGDSAATSWLSVSRSGITPTLANFGEPVQATQFNGSGAGLTGVPVSGVTGLGTAATQNTGTTGATIPLLNGSNTWSDLQVFSGAPVRAWNGIELFKGANANLGGFTWAQLTALYPDLAGGGSAAFGWNYSDGSGEADLLINKDGGSPGGLSIYDVPSTSGPLTLLTSINSTGATFDVPLIPANGLTFQTNQHLIYDAGVDEIGIRLNNGSTIDGYLGLRVIAGIPSVDGPGGALDLSTGNGANIVANLTSTLATFNENAQVNGNLTNTGNLYTSSLIIGQNNTIATGTEIGSFNHTDTPYVDWHSSGTGSDFDVRMMASGGSATSGGGSFAITAGGGIQLIGDTSVQGALSVSPPASSAAAILNAPSNSYQASTDYEENGVIKWQVGKNIGTDPSYFIYNSALQQTAIGIDYLTNAVTLGGSLLSGDLDGFIYPMGAPYNCKGDGTSDDTACMASAETAACGKTLYFGDHIYAVSATENPGCAVHFVGSNRIANQASYGCNSGLKALNQNMTLQGLDSGSVWETACAQMYSAALNTSGTALYITGSQNSVQIVRSVINNSCIGVVLNGANDLVDGVNINSDGGGDGCQGIIVGNETTHAGTVDPKIVNTIVQGVADSTNRPFADMYVEDAGGLYLSNNDMLYGKYGTLIAPGANQEVDWLFAVNTVFGDTTFDVPLQINPSSASGVIKGFMATNSWASNDYGAFTGQCSSCNSVQIQNTAGGTVTDVSFIGLRAYGATNNSVAIFAGTQNVAVDESQLCGYNGSGVWADTGVGNFFIRNNTISPHCAALSGSGNTGIYLGNGGNGGLIITGNKLSDNSTEINGTGTGTNVITNNL